MISVITINLNQAAGLERTLNSIRAQLTRPLELIIIDGGSTDGSLNLIARSQDIITSWISERDNGIYHAMNKGWKKATGTYCLFLNAGDHLHNEHVLAKAEALLAVGKGDICYGNLAAHKDDKVELTEFKAPVSLYYFYSWYLPHPACFIKTSLLEQLGGYYEHYRVISDWAFMVEALVQKATFRHLPITVSDFYADGISARPNNERNQIMEREFAFLQNDFINFRRFRDLEQSRLVKAAVSLKHRIRLIFSVQD